MLGWVIAVLTFVAGSGGLAIIAAPLISHKLEQRRERERARREARAAWVARQREVCTGLLDAVIRFKTLALTLRSLHDDRASRLWAKKTLELGLQQFPSIDDTVRRVRRELDLEPNAYLQEAIERWGDAAIAYQQVLMGPLSPPWNPLRFYLGKAPDADVSRVADEYDARTRDLQAAVRTYMASLESPPKMRSRKRLRLFSRRHQQGGALPQPLITERPAKRDDPPPSERQP